MSSSLRLAMVGILTWAAAGCASSGGSAGGDPGAAPTEGGVSLAQGVRPTNNAQTRAAEQQLELAAAAPTPQAARPFYQTALDSATSAVTLDPTNPLGHRLRGQALIGLDRALEGAAALDRAEELRPVYQLETEGLRERGWIDQYQRSQPLLQSGDYLGAAEVLEGANALYRQRPEIMIVLGQIYAQENQPDRAVDHLRRADSLITARIAEVDSAMVVEWRSQQAEVPVMIAQAYITARRYPEAVATLRGLVDANPDNLMYARNLASVYAQSANADSATAVYGRILRRTDLTPADLHQIGTGLYSIDRFEEAARAFGREATLAVKDRDAFEMWARTLQLHQNRAGAEPTPAQIQELTRAAEAWVALDPYSGVGMLILAQTLNRAGDEARTTQLVRKMDALPVYVGNLQLRRNGNGGGTVTGEVENKKARPGTPVTLNFTFFDRAGNAIGTQSARVTTGAVEAKSTFTVTLSSDRPVDGYSYTLTL